MDEEEEEEEEHSNDDIIIPEYIEISDEIQSFMETVKGKYTDEFLYSSMTNIIRSSDMQYIITYGSKKVQMYVQMYVITTLDLYSGDIAMKRYEYKMMRGKIKSFQVKDDYFVKTVTHNPSRSTKKTLVNKMATKLNSKISLICKMAEKRHHKDKMALTDDNDNNDISTVMKLKVVEEEIIYTNYPEYYPDEVYYELLD